MMSENTPDFAGMGYDAALGKRSWQSVVEELAAAFSAVHAVIVPQMPDRGTGRISGISYVVSNAQCGTYEGPDLLMERAWRLPRGELSVVQNMRADPFIGKSPFYNVTLEGIDIGHTVHVLFAPRQNAVGFFCLTRYSHQPAFSEQELATMRYLVDHLARALEIGDRLGKPVAPQIFESLPYGFALLDRHSRVLRMNALAQSLIASEDGLHMQLNSLHTAHGRIDVEGFLATSRGGTAEPKAMRIERYFSDRPLSAIMTTVPSEWREPAHQDGAVLLVLSDPEWVIFPPESTLTQLFRLTSGEARFVRMLVHRRSLQKASAALAIAPETARRHLKSVFEKTGTHSQSELAQLLVRQPSAQMFASRLIPEDLLRFEPAAE